MFRQRAAVAVVPEPDQAIDATLELPLEQPRPESQPPLPGGDGAAPARAVDDGQARRAREIVARAIAAANQAAAGPMPEAGLPAVAQPSEAPGVAPFAAPEAAPQKDATTAARPNDIEQSSPIDMAAPVTESAAAESATPPARAQNVTLHPVHGGADRAAVAEAQPAVATSEAPAPSPADASSASTGGNAADGGDRPSDGEQTPSGRSGHGGASPRAEAIVVDAFPPQLAARIYESAAAAATSAPPEIGELGDVVPQIVRSITLQSVGEIGHARVQLRPEHLGEVVIELRVEQGDVIASLEADRPEVRAWIESQAGELREALAGQGLELTHLAVRDREESRREEPREHQPRKQKRQPRADQPLRFELPAA
jgi:flagellar hook-length control protein FliK